MTTFTFSDELFSDLHKDVYGFRPRGETFQHWMNKTNEQKQEHWDYMVAYLAENEVEEKRYEERKIAEFEKLVTKMIADGCPSRPDTIRWLHDAYGTQGDNDYLCYQLGLPYGYLGK